MLSKTFFAELAEKSPLVIFNNRLYQVIEDSSGEDFVSIDSHKFGLIEADTLLNLENFYRYTSANEILDYKKNYIKDKLDLEIKSDTSLGRLIQKQAIFDFFINGVFPYFNESEDEIDDLLQGIKKQKKVKRKFLSLEDTLKKASKEFVQKMNLKSKAKPVSNGLDYEDILPVDENGLVEELLFGATNEEVNLLRNAKEEKEVEDLLSSYYGVKVEKEKLQKEDKNPRTLLSVALRDKNILTFCDEIYEFSNSEKSEINIRINGQEYSLCPYSNIENIDASYKSLLLEQFNKEAEEEAAYQNKIKEQSDRAFHRLEEFQHKDSYQDGDIGFIKKDGRYWATLKVHPYVLKEVKHSDGRFYEFDACRVAVMVEYINGDYNYHPSPVVVERYSHPFLSHWNERWQSICMGHYDISSLQGLDKPAQVATLLSDARNVLRSGYTETCGPHKHLDAGHFREISEYDIGGLPITNIKGKNGRK